MQNKNAEECSFMTLVNSEVINYVNNDYKIILTINLLTKWLYLSLMSNVLLSLRLSNDSINPAIFGLF